MGVGGALRADRPQTTRSFAIGGAQSAAPIMPINKYLVRVIFILACFTAVHGEQEPERPKGIRFFSLYNDTIPTSLHLTPDHGISLAGPFTLSFEFAIWKTSPFGFIAHGWDDNERLFILSYNDFQHPDSSYFELSFGKGRESLTIGIPKSYLIEDNWLKVELRFDPAHETVTMKIDGQNQERKMNLPQDVILGLIFGHYPATNDTPNMIIREIHLNGSSNKYWPLNRGYGNADFEITSKDKGELTSGEWLMENHYRWKTSFQRAFQIDPDFEYFSSGNAFILTYGDSLMVLDANTRESELTTMPSALDDQFDMVDDPFKKTLRGFFGGGEGPVVEWNPKIRQWIMDKPLSSKENYHGSGKIIDPRNGNFYTIGGYGHYRVKNHVLKYNEAQLKWDTLTVQILSDDAFNPR